MGQLPLEWDLLPKWLPQVCEEVKNLADDAKLEVVKWDIDVQKEFAMATEIEGAEGLNPSFEEVKKQADCQDGRKLSRKSQRI